MFRVSIADCCVCIDAEQLPSALQKNAEPTASSSANNNNNSSSSDRSLADDQRNGNMLLLRNRRNQNDGVDNNNPNKSTTNIDPYQVLQVRRDATCSEIRHAYKRLALWHHPHRGRVLQMDDDERERRAQVFEVLAACYETLMDSSSRSRCDALLKQQAKRREQAAAAARRQNLMIMSEALGSGRRIIGEGVEDAGRLVNEMFRMPDELAAAMMQQQQQGQQPTDFQPPLSPVSSGSVSSSSVHSSCYSTCREEEEEDGNTTLRGEESLGSPLAISAREQLENSEGDRVNSPPNLIFSDCGISLPGTEENFEGDSILVVGDAENQQLSPSLGHQLQQQQRAIMLKLTASSSDEYDEDDDNRHYTEHETNRLFGGPLALLYRARRWQPFEDPFQVFELVFGSNVFRHHQQQQQDRMRESGINSSLALPPPPPSQQLRRLPSSSLGPVASTPVSPTPSSAWAGSCQQMDDGSVVFTTTRTLHDRVFRRTEVFRVNSDGTRCRALEVTSEPVVEPKEPDPSPPSNDDGDETVGGWMDYYSMSCCLPQFGKVEEDDEDSPLEQDQTSRRPSSSDTVLQFWFCHAWLPECGV